MTVAISQAPKAASRVRWQILIFLFAATAILYIDRSALGILAPGLQEKMGWTEEQYGTINSAFMVAYAICFLLMGRVIDRIGTKAGYALCLSIWSLAAAAHALSTSWLGFAAARFGLAIGQSGNFPAANKAVAEWFPRKERALAVGLFNGGSNVGTMTAPLVIPLVVLSSHWWGWGFLWTLPLSALWIAIWLKFYQGPSRHPRVRATELEIIHDGAEPPAQASRQISWRAIASHRPFWAIAVGKFVADPIWWFYLFWGAKYLYARFGVDLKSIGLPFFLIYFLSWCLGIALGWLSSSFLKRGWTIDKARKMGLLVCGLLAVPVMMVPHVGTMGVAIGLIAVAAGGHCGWSANMFSLISDLFPGPATASVTGFAGFCGAVGGIIATFSVGKILQNAGINGYAVPFAVAGCGYLLALLIIHLLVPKIKAVAF